MRGNPRVFVVLGTAVFSGFLVWFFVVRESGMKHRLSDGSYIEIQKIEISDKPSYEMGWSWEVFCYDFKNWLRKQPWGSLLLPKYVPSSSGITIVWSIATPPSPSLKKSECLTIWFSGKSGNSSVDNHPPGTGVVADLKEQIILTDDHGCPCVKEGIVGNCNLGINGSREIKYLRFSSFNQASETFHLEIHIPGEKESVHFSLKNPNRIQPPAPSPMAKALPIELPLRDGLSLVLAELKMSEKKKLEPILQFQKSGSDVSNLYQILFQDLSDSLGGSGQEVCAHAPEWIVSGKFHPRSEAIPMDSRLKLYLAKKPAAGECVPILLSETPTRFPKLKTAWLIGPGTYVFDSEKQLSVLKFGEWRDAQNLAREEQNRISAALQRSRTYRNYNYGLVSSEDSWKGNSAFLNEQYLLNSICYAMAISSEKPVLLMKVEEKISTESRFYLGNAPEDIVRVEKDEITRWIVFPVSDWKENEAEKDVKISYAEAVPLEFHILPTEEMRSAIPLEKKEKK